jgi:hypothetical protein
MQFIAWAFYSVLIITYLASAGFIVFHILRYSLCRTNAIFGVSFFLVVFILLFFINISLFSSLPLEALLGGSASFSRSSGF